MTLLFEFDNFNKRYIVRDGYWLIGIWMADTFLLLF